MKNFVLMLGVALFLSFNAVAAEGEIRMRCLTEFPTTTFVAKTSGGMVSLNMIQHNGNKYMPIFNGMVTPSDFKFLQDEAALLTRLPDRITFSWPVENCKITGPNLFQCFRGNPTQVGGIDISSFYFYTSKIKTEIFDTSIDMYRVTFGMIVNSRDHSISMEYSPSDCLFR